MTQEEVCRAETCSRVLAVRFPGATRALGTCARRVAAWNGAESRGSASDVYFSWLYDELTPVIAVL